MKENTSIQGDTWRRLKKNKGAVFGMIVILLSVITALFSYTIAPDHSPYANRMILEIGGQKPAFSQQFLLIPKHQNTARKSWIVRLFSGEDDRYDWLPIVSSLQKGDSLIVQQYH